MKKLITLIFTAVLLVSCTDYDSQFDQVDAKIKELAAANASLEAELAAMAALNAQVSAATAAKLAEFQGAVGAIVQALQDLGTASAATIAQVNAIIQAISDLSAQVAANAATAEEIAAAIAAIQDMLDTINENVLHHSGGGSTADSGTEHHSGGGSTDDGGSTSAVTDNGDDVLDLIVTAPAGTTEFRLTGPWWGWDPNGGPVGTDNGDGTFTISLPNMTANMEYLYVADGVQEVLYDNAGNGECTERVDAGLINTDYYSYGNRIWILGSGDQAETYDSCSIDTVN
jgi:PBP1b-binding outer membrane lipoprotein LpoB